MIDPAIVVAFRRDGYVVVDGLVSDDELDHYEPLVTAAVAHRKAGDTRPLAEGSRDSGARCIPSCESCRRRQASSPRSHC